MTRRVHGCIYCNGGTRHGDRRCAECRNIPVEALLADAQALATAGMDTLFTEWPREPRFTQSDRALLQLIQGGRGG